MKIKIEIDEALEEDVVLIRCRSLTEEIGAVQPGGERGGRHHAEVCIL